jgi:hypothetical protein
MQLNLKRHPSANGCTLSELTINGKHECYICEDVVRPASAPKVFGQTAIPAGTYQVANTFSPRFGKYLPLLLNVPGYAGIRIHPGNTAADTEGCLLPGTELKPDGTGVSNSRGAFAQLFAKIQAAEKKEKILITIS